MGFIGFMVVLTIVAIVIYAIVFANASPEQRQQMLYGPLNVHMHCPHCQTAGQVRTQPITQKKGVSGGKATAALLTGGVSMLATGLSRKEKNTQAHCCKCHNTWVF